MYPILLLIIFLNFSSPLFASKPGRAPLNHGQPRANRDCVSKLQFNFLPNQFVRGRGLTARSVSDSELEIKYALSKARKVRFTLLIDSLKQQLKKSNSPQTIINGLIESDTRNIAFHVEALLRLYIESEYFEKIGSKKDQARNTQNLTEALRLMEGLENNLGSYAEHVQRLDWLKLLQEKLGHNIVSDKKIAFFETAKKIAYAKLSKYLSEEGWIGQQQDRLRIFELFNSISEELKAIPKKKDRKIIVKGIARYIKKTREKKFDLQDLEKGIHPLRRHLRWINIMVRSANLFKLDNRFNFSDQFKDLDAGDAVKKYGGLEIYGFENHPVFIDQRPYLTLAQIIGILGTAKDIGQFEVALGEDRGLSQYLPQYINPIQAAVLVYKVMKQSDLLQILENQILEGLN